MSKKTIVNESIGLLQEMIKIPSISRNEGDIANHIASFLESNSINYTRENNNLWAKDPLWKDNQPVILFNSHIDTVRVVEGWDENPHGAVEKDGKIFGLGSNDAGASVVSLLAVFRILSSQTDRNYNIIWSATAEEEVSGKNGVESILPHLGKIDLGIVGEPTQMQMAVAEKGLMVIDGMAHGKAGHAARDEGENAIYKAIKDIAWIENSKLDKVSELMGPVKMTVTQVEAGKQHNVVPDRCSFVIDVRSNECYTNHEIFDILQSNTNSELKARSYRLNSSTIDDNHPFVLRGKEIGLSTYGSPTLSDQALMPFTTIKIGPGDSARSHTANEYIVRDEIVEGVEVYCKLLTDLSL